MLKEERDMPWLRREEGIYSMRFDSALDVELAKMCPSRSSVRDVSLPGVSRGGGTSGVPVWHLIEQAQVEDRRIQNNDIDRPLCADAGKERRRWKVDVHLENIRAGESGISWQSSHDSYDNDHTLIGLTTS